MNSLWTSKIYYMFGFLFLCFGLMTVTTAATSILLVYFMLCAEDYRWQWRSFAGAGMTGFYVFVNAIIFWATRVSFGGVIGAVLYLGYSALIGFLMFILTGRTTFFSHLPSSGSLIRLGTIGFISSWIFVRKIYSSIKVD